MSRAKPEATPARPLVLPVVGLKFRAAGRAGNQYEVVQVKGQQVTIHRRADGVVLETTQGKFSQMVAEVL